MNNLELNINGSVLEGGGQILRNSVALSALLKRAISVSKIRSGRKQPGLRAQHKSGIQLVSQICKAKLIGCEDGSLEITFCPENIQSGTYRADTKTAGSICLLVQAVLPVLCFGNTSSNVTLIGGTNADMAPPVEHYTLLFQHILSRFGIKFELETTRRGFYPRGNGQVLLKVDLVKDIVPLIMLEQGEIVNFTGLAFVGGNMDARIAEEMRSSAISVLSKEYPSASFNIDLDINTLPAYGIGCGITIVAHTSTGCMLGSSGLGKKGTRAVIVGSEAAKMLDTDIKSGSCLDQYSQDQVIIFMALAKGQSSVRIGEVSLHTKTAIYIAERLTSVKFTIVQDMTSNIITCDGIGHTNTYI